MGRTQKKNSKGRLDRYYYLAKEKGYRARSSFKIIQINEKYGHFLEKSKVVIDLCAAPGSWCQVASNLCPINSLIIGVDIVPIKPLPNCITFQSDITTEDCRSKLRGHLKTWKADTVLHDGAPNVGLGWVQDAFTQSQLVLKALKLAAENLTQGGTFVTKVFRSKDYNNLMWVFQQLFEKVEATKPPASRNVSAEIFVVCKGFKAPKKLDPRLLDPKEVFEELDIGKVNNEAKVFNPEKRTRKREGYDEGDYLLYKEMLLSEFIRDEEPINTLGSLNCLVEPPSDDPEWKMLRKLRHCTPEFRECLKDLKVLGKKDFKLILKFRKEARALLDLDEDDGDKPQVEVEALTEEEQINKELEQLTEKQKKKRRREKKRANELKQKEIRRMQMSMLTDMSIGIEAEQTGAGSLFNLKSAEKTGQIDDLAKGKKRIIFTEEERAMGTEIDAGDEHSDADTDEELNSLEAQLDDMYEQYKQKRAEKDSNYRAKLARGDHNDEAWDGIKSDNDDSDENQEDYEMDVDSDDESDNDEQIQAIIDQKKKEELSRNAKIFFESNSVFEDLDDADLLSSMNVSESPSNSSGKAHLGVSKLVIAEDSSITDEIESDFEVVGEEREVESDSDYDSDELSLSRQIKNAQVHKDKVDLTTVEAMTLAHQIALGKMNKHDLVNEGVNKYSFRDRDNLPDWFLEDERQHSKIVKPITKEAAAAIREKQKELNARPIKKVLEAQGRKKMRAMRRLEKLKKKSDLINEDSAKSERDKADEILRLMRKLTKKQKVKPKATLVVARGQNRGLSGRPKGVKGKYKMVDGVMKNELRALRRIAKKHK